MVDTLLSFSNSKVVSSFTLKKDNIFICEDQFLESGIIENMAQTVALHTGYDFFLRNETPPTGYIGSIKNIEISHLPKLNEKIITEVEILHEFLKVTLVEVIVKNQHNELLAKGQMKTVIAD